MRSWMLAQRALKGAQPSLGDRLEIGRKCIERRFEDVLDLPRPARATVMHVLDDHDRVRSGQAGPDGSMRRHSDLFAQLAQNGLVDTFLGAAPTAGQAPSGGVAKPDEDHEPFGRQRDGVNARPLASTAPEQRISRGERDAQHSVDQACHPDRTRLRAPEFQSSACRAKNRARKGARMSGKSSLTDEDYEELLKPMGKELSAMARWVSETKQRLVIVFEGRDTA